MYGFGFRLGGRRRLAPAGPILWEVDFSALTTGVVTNAALAAYGLVFQRASGSATYQSGANAICAPAAYAGVDELRISDRGSGLKGFLIEESRTNAISRGNEFSHAFWTAFLGAAVTGNYVAGPDGVTGTASLITTPSGGGFGESAGSALGGTTCGSVWAGGAGSTQQPGFNLYEATTNDRAFNNGSVAHLAWTRFDSTNVAAAGNATAVVAVDGRNWSGSGGLAAGPKSVVIAYAQRELGKGPTSYIPTAGSTVTRAGERLYHATPASLLDGGRLGFEVEFFPLWAWDEYGGNQRLFTLGAGTYAEVNVSTRVLTLSVGGSAHAFATAIPTWTRLPTVKVWVEGGGGALNSVAKWSVGGAVTALGTSGAAQAAISPGASVLDIGSSGTASQFSGLVKRVRAYAADQRPAWAA